MGSVWTARHVLLDLPVAVKFIVAGNATAGRLRFEREAKAAAMLQSPHVVHIHDYGVDTDAPYLVMELLEGEDLSTRLATRTRLSPCETAAIVIQVARALRRAAEAAIVHRDLKPSNVFIVRGDEDEGGEIVKVLDFGVAKAPRITLDGEATKTGTIVGSPRYMSPEQARARAGVDPRSDLWSLAVIAYRALTGRVPFPGDDLPGLVLRICAGRPPPPSQVVPELGTAFDAFFERALQPDPDQRFQTARAFATAFAAAAGEELPPLSTRAPLDERPAGEPSERSRSSRVLASPAKAEASEKPEPPPAVPPAALEETRRSCVPPSPRESLGDEAPHGSAEARSSEPFILPQRPWSSIPEARAADELGATSRPARRPWHVRLRQGIAGAGIASIVVGGGMSVLLFRQRAVEGATATAPAAPRSVAMPRALPTCVVVPATITSAPATAALQASAAPPAPVPSSVPERRRWRYTPLRP